MLLDQGSSNDSHMPYSIVMEIGLQTSGILTSWVEAPLTMDRDNILFRNLDATAEMIMPDIDLRGKTIINTTHATGYSMLGTMGIHRFEFELSVEGEGVFYKGSTSFGWFVPEVFEKQTGLDGGKTKMPWHLDAAASRKHPNGTVAPKSELRTYDLGSPSAWGEIYAAQDLQGSHLLRRRSTQARKHQTRAYSLSLSLSH